MTPHCGVTGILTLVLFWGFVCSQQTGFSKETCVYSFVVPGSSSSSSVDISRKSFGNNDLQEEIDELRSQHASLERRIELLEGEMTISPPSKVITGNDELTDVIPGQTATVYVMNGCPRNVHFNIVQLVPTVTGSVQVYYRTNSSRVEIPLRSVPFSIYCTRDKYILVQSRHLGLQTSFNRSYSDYKHGFGSFHSEFWIGLEKLHLITSNTFARFSLRFEGRMSNGYDNTVEYHDVRIGDERSGYRLTYKSRGTSTRANGNLASNVVFSCRGAPYVNGTHVCARTGFNGWWFRNNICKRYDLNFNADQPFWDVRVPVGMTQVALKPLYG